MSQVTLLRVKRRRSQDPIEAWQISSKKGRFENSQKSQIEENKLTFTLAATLEKHHVDDHGHLEKALDTSDKLRQDPKKPLSAEDLKTKMRKANKKATEKKKFQILKDHRGIEDETKKIKFFDVIESKDHQDVVTCNGMPMPRDKAVDKQGHEDFVYDVYKVDKEIEFDDEFLEKIANIEPLDSFDELLNEYRDDEDIFEDDSDSNDENNWRNDYPDEEEYADLVQSGASSDEDDAYGLFEELNLGDDNDSDNDEGLIHSKSFQRDADMHGEGYAKFKRNVVKQFQNDDDDIDNVDEY